MSDDINWNDIESNVIPDGRYIGWGKIGQAITGEVIKYADEGGTDFNGSPCPLLILELVDAADNYRDKGTTLERLEAGELVSISAGQANLARHLRGTEPKPGDVVRITFASTYKGSKGEGKSFEMKIARGARRRAEPADLFSET